MTEKFNVDEFFQDQVNEHCELPAIDQQSAFSLYYAAIELVSAIAELRRLIPELGGREIGKLVRSMATDRPTGDISAAVVRMISNVAASS